MAYPVDSLEPTPILRIGILQPPLFIEEVAAHAWLSPLTSVGVLSTASLSHVTFVKMKT